MNCPSASNHGFLNTFAPTILALSVFLAGCGQKLSGRWEAVQAVPQVAVPGLDPKVQAMMNESMKNAQNLTKMSLEFEGSKVRMGTAGVISELHYRLDGNKLEVIIEEGGQKMIMPMTLEPDGSISYMTMRYYRVK